MVLNNKKLLAACLLYKDWEGSECSEANLLQFKGVQLMQQAGCVFRISPFVCMLKERSLRILKRN